MNVIKHGPYTAAMRTLGSVPPEGSTLDSSNLLTEAVTAGQRLFAGQPVVIKDGVAFSANHAAVTAAVVDPFLSVGVDEGERFWCLYLPAPLKEDENETRCWLSEFCNEMELDYYGLLEMVNGLLSGEPNGLVGYSGSWHVVQGRVYLDDEQGGSIPLDERFWRAVEIVTGKTLPDWVHASVD